MTEAVQHYTIIVKKHPTNGTCYVPFDEDCPEYHRKIMIGHLVEQGHHVGELQHTEELGHHVVLHSGPMVK